MRLLWSIVGHMGRFPGQMNVLAFGYSSCCFWCVHVNRPNAGWGEYFHWWMPCMGWMVNVLHHFRKAGWHLFAQYLLINQLKSWVKIEFTLRSNLKLLCFLNWCSVLYTKYLQLMHIRIFNLATIAGKMFINSRGEYMACPESIINGHKVTKQTMSGSPILRTKARTFPFSWSNFYTQGLLLSSE